MHASTSAQFPLASGVSPPPHEQTRPAALSRNPLVAGWSVQMAPVPHGLLMQALMSEQVDVPLPAYPALHEGHTCVEAEEQVTALQPGMGTQGWHTSSTSRYCPAPHTAHTESEAVVHVRKVHPEMGVHTAHGPAGEEA